MKKFLLILIALPVVLCATACCINTGNRLTRQVVNQFSKT